MALFHSKPTGVWQQFPFPHVIFVLLLFLTKDISSQKHSISVSSRGGGAGIHIWCFQFCTFPTSLNLKSSRLLPLYGTASLLLYTGAQLDASSPLAGVVSHRSATARVWQAMKIRQMPVPAKPCESKWAWVTELEWVRRIWDTHFIAFPGYLGICSLFRTNVVFLPIPFAITSFNIKQINQWQRERVYLGGI